MRARMAGAVLGLALLACRERPVDPGAAARAASLAGDEARQRGDAGSARADYERALQLAQAADDPVETMRAADKLFYMAWEETAPRRALEFALTSFAAAEKSGKRDLEFRADLSLYSALFELGDLAGAGRALERAERAAGTDAAKLTYVWVNRGALRQEEGRMALSRDALNRALDLAGEKQDARFYRSLHLNLVKASLVLGDLPAAERHLGLAERHAEAGASASVLSYYRSCVEHARGRQASALTAIENALAQDPPSGWAWELLLQQGRVQEALGDRRQAEASYEKAAGVVEAARAELGFDELKATLLDARRQPLEALFRLQAEDGRFRDALATAERATARSFLDAFVDTSASRPEKAGQDWPAMAAMAAVDRAEALKALLPALSQSAAVAPRPIGAAIAALGDRHALVFFEADDRFWRITIGRSRLDIAPLGASTEMARLVDDLLARPDLRQPAEALGQRLLPHGSLPPPGAPVYLIPDGALGQIPFAALRIGGRYLVEDHALVYLPSLSAIAAKAATAGQPAPQRGPAIVLGDPNGDLPAAAREAREVAVQLTTAPLLGPDATREVLAGAAGAAVLHLAAHTGVGPQGPWLALADGKVGPGFLLARHLRPRLVTLATCASAARRGRGLWGSLAAAFLAAGSPAVLASLWSVEDEPARRFVLRFYAAGGVRDPATALAAAQRQAIAAGEPPSAWAPYVLVATH